MTGRGGGCENTALEEMLGPRSGKWRKGWRF
jgi:hypothetical protein